MNPILVKQLLLQRVSRNATSLRQVRAFEVLVNHANNNGLESKVSRRTIRNKTKQNGKNAEASISWLKNQKIMSENETGRGTKPSTFILSIETAEQEIRENPPGGLRGHHADPAKGHASGDTMLTPQGIASGVSFDSLAGSVSRSSGVNGGPTNLIEPRKSQPTRPRGRARGAPNGADSLSFKSEGGENNYLSRPVPKWKERSRDYVEIAIRDVWISREREIPPELSDATAQFEAKKLELDEFRAIVEAHYQQQEAAA